MNSEFLKTPCSFCHRYAPSLIVFFCLYVVLVAHPGCHTKDSEWTQAKYTTYYTEDCTGKSTEDKPTAVQDIGAKRDVVTVRDPRVGGSPTRTHKVSQELDHQEKKKVFGEEQAFGRTKVQAKSFQGALQPCRTLWSHRLCLCGCGCYVCLGFSGH